MNTSRLARQIIFGAQKNILKLSLKSGLLKCYHPLPWIGWLPEDRVAAVDERWRLISANLPAEPFSALDIGCNAGYFSLRLAERGGLVTGIEQARAMLWLARGVSASCDIGGVGFAYYSLNIKNIQSLPHYDVILLLSVYHHFVHFYGAEQAKFMLGILIERTRKCLFFETAPSYDQENKVLDNSGSLEEIEALLRSYPGVRSVNLLGRRPGDAHERGLFLVSK